MTRRALVLLGLACTLLIAAPPAEAQYFGRNKVQYDDFDFRSIETDHFELFYYPAEERAVKDVARMAERWYERHTQSFQRELAEKRPLIFYANDADFQQTNVIGGFISQGTGGVTESLKERVVMPLTGSYKETNHVLGHELIHSFQYDFLLSDEVSQRAAATLPLWLIEGMAEYLSVGRVDPHTAMWLRDAARRDDLPSVEDLTTDPYTYFPYRYGQAYMAYIGGKYGDATVPNLFRTAGQVGLDSAIVYTLGITPDSLSNEWRAAVKEAYLPLMEGRTPPAEVGRPVIEQRDDAQLNIAPSVSPDGKYVAFISERDLFTVNIFVANTETGEIVEQLDGVASDPHFDAIRYINSAGTWSPDGRRLAFVTFAEGDNEIAIWNVDSGDIERHVKVQGVTAISDPAWSPDGDRLAFSGMDGGLSDLYVLDLQTNAVRQLTNDRYLDLQPTWSPDSRWLAFSTDRGPGGTDFDALAFAEPRIGLIDVESTEIRVLRPFGQAQHHNPAFSTDGRSVFFISDQDGFKDIYRYGLETGITYRVTKLKTGVSGITGMAPAMSVARQNGRMLFSVFAEGNYSIYALEAGETFGEEVEVTPALAEAAVLPPLQQPGTGLVSSLLDDPERGLPAPQTFSPDDYSPRLSLDYVAPPSIGVSAGGTFGTQLSGGVAFFFSDMLNNHQLAAVVQAQGSLKDIGGQLSYINRESRFNYGVSASHIPLLFGGARAFVAEDPETELPVQVIERQFQRIYIDQMSVSSTYPLSTTRRFEFGIGATRYGYDFEVERTFIFANGFVDREEENLDDAEPDPAYFARGSASLVGDYSFFGLTSPVRGGRYRFEASPLVGTDTYVTLLADYRRYFLQEPFTFAVRGLHVGNYGAERNELFANEYLGYSYYPGFIRGYSFSSFDASECTSIDGTCAEINRLQGTRIGLASVELRLPLLGPEQLGLITFPYLPTELTAFADGAVAWTADEAPTLAFKTDSDERVPVFSAGLSTRVNVLGYLVLELYYAYPFQRPEKGAHFGLQIAPGW